MTNEKASRDYDLQDRLIDFAVRVMSVVEALPNNRIGNHIAGQLSRSGTAPAPNHGEAQSAESRKDSVHKMKIALKELRETRLAPDDSAETPDQTNGEAGPNHPRVQRTDLHFRQQRQDR